MIENLERQHIDYRLKVKRGELMAEGVYYEVILAETDLSKVS